MIEVIDKYVFRQGSFQPDYQIRSTHEPDESYFLGWSREISHRLGKQGASPAARSDGVAPIISLTHKAAHRMLPPRKSKFLSKSNKQQKGGSNGE
jgi:hypothetical protein